MSTEPTSTPTPAPICALKLRIDSDMKDAMRAKNTAKLGTIRLAMAAFKQKEVDERIVLTNDHILQILEKMIKQRRESIRQYTEANRLDLAEVEQAEIEILNIYLPQALSPEEIKNLITQAISDAKNSGAVGPQLMGQVMAKLKPQMQGRADMSQVSLQVKNLLA